MGKSETTAVNRKADIVSAAIEVFSELGYYRATTAQVAKRANISQPYVFRFFATKEQLLLTAIEVSWTRVIESFRKIVETAPSETLEQLLIQEYEGIQMKHQNEMFLQLQAQCIREEAIQEAMREGFKQVREMVLKAFYNAGIANPEERTMLFLARGMLCNVAVAIEMPELMKR
ncbi:MULTISPECIES: TetR/AcrR family transcriptional regulator [Paenibacillus]|uniref:TetR family transcriptional regulator n=1 Tax=Paenibacillus vini TaxID=1476024 RepID=A0ABQ4MDK5_9BACL|nr:TetR/AcrR family transcriptional regulator [Paenibacillus vini]MDN4068896.1 TetR/AcrR family transcriptional regulator [Paenibacillus vini]GIP53727.1 TetR family transcriptional regulator [Paenibacillus vini]